MLFGVWDMPPVVVGGKRTLAMSDKEAGPNLRRSPVRPTTSMAASSCFPGGHDHMSEWIWFYALGIALRIRAGTSRDWDDDVRDSAASSANTHAADHTPEVRRSPIAVPRFVSIPSGFCSPLLNSSSANGLFCGRPAVAKYA
jgi:hypothetical protein